MKRMFEMATRSSIQALRRTVPALLVTLLTLVTLTAMADTRITYYHNDLLGSTTAATNEQGEILWQRAYYPFGEKFKNPAESSEDRLAYTGKLHNDDTGLTYMNARYYDPVVGRFAAMDTVGPLEGGVQHLNGYSYSYNNPYRYTDPTGLVPDSVDGDDDDPKSQGLGGGGAGGGLNSIGPRTGLDGDNVQVGAKTPGFEGPKAPPSASNGAPAVPNAIKTAEQRAQEIHSVLNPRAQRARTTAVVETEEGVRVVSSSERRLSPAQRAELKSNEVEGVGVGHAETTAISAAKEMGLNPVGAAASRGICGSCANTMSEQGVAPLSSLKTRK